MSRHQLPTSRAEHEDFIIEHYPDGRFRLCLDTSNPDKIPRFRQALDCIEGILKLSEYRRSPSDEIDGDWAE